MHGFKCSGKCVKSENHPCTKKSISQDEQLAYHWFYFLPKKAGEDSELAIWHLASGVL